MRDNCYKWMELTQNLLTLGYASIMVTVFYDRQLNTGDGTPLIGCLIRKRVRITCGAAAVREEHQHTMSLVK